eukprot:bmy_22058T0
MGEPCPSASGELLVFQPCPPSDGLLFRDQLDQMPNTTTCIKWALRLYPPVPVIGRDLSKPITFPDGRSLPAGMSFTTPTNLSNTTWKIKNTHVLSSSGMLCPMFPPQDN